MAKVVLKTRETDASVEDFINSVENDERRKDAFRLLEIFKRITKEQPKMWGPAMIGFGSKILKYASGRELEWMLAGFSPRKANLSIHLICDIKVYQPMLEELGKYKTGVGCLYIKRLADVDLKVLEKLIKAAYAASVSA